MHKIEEDYPAYKALARQAMVFGIPLIPLALTVMLGLILTMATLPFLEGKALFFILLPLPFVIFLKSISVKDDQAARIVFYEALWFFRQRNSKMFNDTNTILANKNGRQLNDYQRFFEQGTQSTTGNFRFSAKDLPTRCAKYR